VLQEKRKNSISGRKEKSLTQSLEASKVREEKNTREMGPESRRGKRVEPKQSGKKSAARAWGRGTEVEQGGA